MINSCIVAGIVVLYNPVIGEVLENINSYIDDLDFLYCIDNSDKTRTEFDTKDKISYIPLGKNTGLANALSIGCDVAIKNGAEILVTMDQDTFFEKKSLKKLLHEVMMNGNIVVTPNIKRITRKNGERYFHESAIYDNKDVEVSWAITSGSVFTSDLYRIVNGFDKCLFIGQIDQDFCTSVYQNGYKVIRKGNAFIYQELGNAKKYNLLFIKKGYAPNLSPIRYYYVFRNERYLRKKWGNAYNPNRVSLYKYFFVVLLFENNKFEKIRNMISGYVDGKKLKGNRNENIC